MTRGRGLVVLVGCVLAAADAQAWFWEQEAKEPPAKAAPAAPVESPRDKAAKEWLAKLDKTQWRLTVRKTGSSKVAYEDTVTFDDRRVTSEWLSKDGYPDSNFTLTVQDGGAAVWETMQTKAGEGTALWRGEIQDERMSGILIKQPLEGAAEDFSFAASKIVPETPPASQPAESVPTSP